jgi:hypothetical protein
MHSIDATAFFVIDGIKFTQGGLVVYLSNIQPPSAIYITHLSLLYTYSYITLLLYHS